MKYLLQERWLIPIFAIMLVTYTVIPTTTFALQANASRGQPPPLPPPIPFNPNATLAATATTWPHVGGYMTGSRFGVPAVQVTVSFAGTTPSSIQSNNRLIAGIFDTVFDSTTSGLDYGYRNDVVLTNTGSMYVIGDAWKFCEGYPPFTQCGSTPTQQLLYNTYTWITASVSSSITLKLAYDSYGVVHWFYQVDAGPMTEYGYFIPPSTSQRQFMVGTYYVWFNGHTAKYFQFAIESDYNIGHGGWYALISNPKYFLNGAWSLVPQARAVQGGDAFLDARWLWGGADYTNVNGQYQYNSAIGPYKLKLFYTTSTLTNGQLLWG